MFSSNKKSNVNKEAERRIDTESLGKINLSADTDKDGKAAFSELYGMFRGNGLTRLESLYNSLFIHCLNKISCAVNTTQLPGNLFSHPVGWFKDKERLAKKSVWNVILSVLLFFADVLARLRLLPGNITKNLTAAGEGFENSAIVGSFLKKALPFVLLLAFGVGVFNYTTASAQRDVVIDLYIDGVKLGSVRNREVYYSAIDIAEKNLSNMLGIGYKIPDGTASFMVSLSDEPVFLSDSEIATALVKSSEKYLSIGYGLYIDGTLVAVSASRMIMDNILEETLELYNTLYSATKRKDELTGFANSVRINEITVPKTVIKSEEEIRKILGLDGLSTVSDLILRDKSVEKMTVLEVSNMLPKLESISAEDISAELPEDAVYYLDSTTVDSSLTNDSAPAIGETDGETGENQTTVLTFKTTKTKTVTEIMPCDVSYVYDNDVLEGRKIVSVPGVDGIKRATYEISYVGDEEIGRELISQEILKQPVTKIIRVGTRPASDFDSETSVTGTFIRPCAGGTVTSTFSGRTLFGVYEFHGALDIADRFGTPIVASDGGEVVFAGWNGTYGNCIIIDHGDGIETLYAHLSAYAVEKGDKVGQGWKIGEMGRTGRATGIHVHFEVRVNGVRQDPYDYLEQ